MPLLSLYSAQQSSVVIENKNTTTQQNDRRLSHTKYKIKYIFNTTSLIRHVKNKHSKEYNKFFQAIQAKAPQQTLRDMFKTK